MDLDGQHIGRHDHPAHRNEGRVGNTTPTTDSSIAQTFTVPPGGGTLSFWYRVNCPDPVTFDWATATLKDNVTNVTTTILPKTCNTAGTWVQVTTDVGANANHSVTLTLANHDDNLAADPTYTLYDDAYLSGPDFTIAANPSSLSIAQGRSATSTISTTVIGQAGTVTLSASGLPAGATASFGPNSVTAGSSSTMTINVGSSTPPGSYTVTATGTEPTAPTHSVDTALTVAAPPQPTASVSPTSLDFGTQGLGTTTGEDVTITNTGTATLTVSNIGLTNTTDFGFTATAAPFALAPSATSTVNVKFFPSALGSRAGTLAITTNASPPVTNVGLSGTGTANGNWTASFGHDGYVLAGRNGGGDLSYHAAGNLPARHAKPLSVGRGDP